MQADPQSQTNGVPLHPIQTQPPYNTPNAATSNEKPRQDAVPNGPSAPAQQQQQQPWQPTDEDDENAKRRASKDLTESWMDRLQLISVITTFFASTEAGLLQVTNPGKDDDAGQQLVNATFLVALVLHIWAAIISFMGAFFLVRYKLKEAKNEEKEAGGPASPNSHRGMTRPKTTASLADYLTTPVWTANPHLETYGPFNQHPPTHLLSRCHNLCILLTFAGFVFALLGIVSFAWVLNPLSVGIVSSISTAVALGGFIWVFADTKR
ncbi:hypothetical protein R3P38DRAFT_2841842 [Favolaschia claudopus]|uniref:Transmembrane protein n=1 Tax=Favolaschia claudopus TaxID=2862362 RepID=A0AAW0E3N7_9AGAR